MPGLQGYSTRGSLSAIFAGARDTDVLSELEGRITQCVTGMLTAWAVTGLEGLVETFKSQQTTYTEIVETNNRVLAKLEELGGAVVSHPRACSRPSACDYLCSSGRP